jgi:hypothetical protein
MILAWHPKGGDRREWVFRPRELRSTEAELIERNTGWSYGEFGVMFLKGSMLAYRAAIYALRRLDGEANLPPWREFSISAAEVNVKFEADEVAALRKALTAGDVDPDQAANLEAILDQAEAELEGDGPPPGASPFASPTPGTAT